MKFRLERSPAPAWATALIPIVAILVTFVITSVFIILADANPFTAYYNFIIVPLSSKFSALEVLVKATPLIFTGIAVTFAFSVYWGLGQSPNNPSSSFSTGSPAPAAAES